MCPEGLSKGYVQLKENNEIGENRLKPTETKGVFDPRDRFREPFKDLKKVTKTFRSFFGISD